MVEVGLPAGVGAGEAEADAEPPGEVMRVEELLQADLHRKDPEISVSGNYVLSYDASPTFGRQDDWRWCKHCQGIFHGPSEGTSRCPAPGHPNHQRGASEGTGYSLALHQRRLTPD